MARATKRPPPHNGSSAAGAKLNGKSEKSNGRVEPFVAPVDGKSTAKISKVATVSHTLESALAERLREFAFRERISESAVIEHALLVFFAKGDDATLGVHLRKLGVALRRKT